MAAKKSIQFPWDLPQAAERHWIPVSPVVAQAMAEGEPEEQEAIALLAPKIEKLPEGDGYGFSLPIYYGALLSERKFLEKANKAERGHQRKTLELLKKAATETGHSLMELANAHDSGNMSEFLDDLAPYMAEFSELEDSSPAKQRGYVAATGHMRRIIANWQIENSEALHESILNELIQFEAIDMEPVVREVEKPQTQKSD